MELTEHPDRPGIFLTPDGRVFRELPVSIEGFGYKSAHVPEANGRLRTVRVHTLIAETFVGPRPFTGAEVRHLDGNQLNNDPSNLAWGSRADNVQDAIRHGTHPRGEHSGSAKLSLVQAQELYDRAAAGESPSALAADFGVSPQTVCDIRAARTWPQVQR